MKIARYYSNNDIRLDEIPKPTIGSGELLVKVKKSNLVDPSKSQNTSITEIFYNYGLMYKPSYQVSLVRKGSPAHLAGIMEGDIVLEINGKPAYSLKMQEVIHILSIKENKKIKLLIDRNGEHIRYEFILKSLL